MDSYEEIPIYYVEDKDMPYVIVSKFEKAFTMKIRQPQENIESIFQLQVHEFTPQEAKELIGQKVGTWILDENGNTLPVEKATEKILTSVCIEVWTEIEFIINDKNMYLFGNITNEKSIIDDEYDNTY